MFPPTAQKLDLLLLHELENERHQANPADAKLAQILVEVKMENNYLQSCLREQLGRVSKAELLFTAQYLYYSYTRTYSNSPCRTCQQMPVTVALRPDQSAR